MTHNPTSASDGRKNAQILHNVTKKFRRAKKKKRQDTVVVKLCLSMEKKKSQSNHKVILCMKQYVPNTFMFNGASINDIFKSKVADVKTTLTFFSLG